MLWGIIRRKSGLLNWFPSFRMLDRIQTKSGFQFRVTLSESQIALFEEWKGGYEWKLCLAARRIECNT
jgi:hypothetical protein